jgi:endonuclease/exonuclease/phosphatase family metal-dependent hydrolase
MTFRLMTYNILDGGAGREASLIEVIRAVAPDVVVMPEVIQPAALERMASELAMECRLAHGPDRERKVGVLSRLPILGWRSLPSRRPWREGVEVSVCPDGGQPVTIYGLHLRALHTWSFEWWRTQEIRIVLEHIRRAAPGPHLLAGDFNAIVPGDRVRMVWRPTWLWAQARLWFRVGPVMRRALRPLLKAGYVDCFRLLHSRDDGFTFPASDPKARLDYVFANPTLSVSLRECRVVTQPPDVVRIASDHLPVLAEFA